MSAQKPKSSITRHQILFLSTNIFDVGIFYLLSKDPLEAVLKIYFFNDSKDFFICTAFQQDALSTNFRSCPVSHLAPSGAS